MSDALLPSPGLLHGFYPERPLRPRGWMERLDQAFSVWPRRDGMRAFRSILGRVQVQRQTLALLSPLKLADFLTDLRRDLRNSGLTPPLIERAFALVALTSTRELGMNPYDEQLFAGWLMLSGAVAEMETGEGKTLAAAFPACTAALAGVPVHVITANDYLVSRDAGNLEPLYRALGLSVGTVIQTSDTAARRVAYASDVVYVSNKQVVFDYLRDRRVLGTDPATLRGRLHPLMGGPQGAEPAGAPLMRGLCFALVDEADSVLIDDARMPLILSNRRSADNPAQFAVALGLARRLTEGHDFIVDRSARTVALAGEGTLRLTSMARGLQGVWTNRRVRDELIVQALSALHLFTRDRHYVVQKGSVVLVDENTGRLMPDRSLSRGLHQMVEVKEGCKTTEQAETLARISYSQYFRRYHRMAGMSGTVAEAASELRDVYGLRVTRVPTHRPSRRSGWCLELYRDVPAKRAALLASVVARNKEGRPVLIGTGSVAESEQVSGWLAEAGHLHTVLNATQDAEEARVITHAGEAGRITVSTNMAGRGSDIPLGRGVAELGGLHVIATCVNDAARIDRQLQGRSARQGEPGSFQTIVSLDEPLLTEFFSLEARHWLERIALGQTRIARFVAARAVRLAQRAVERRHARIRRAGRTEDDRLEELLAFAGGTTGLHRN